MLSAFSFDKNILCYQNIILPKQEQKLHIKQKIVASFSNWDSLKSQSKGGKTYIILLANSGSIII